MKFYFYYFANMLECFSQPNMPHCSMVVATSRASDVFAAFPLCQPMAS